MLRIPYVPTAYPDEMLGSLLTRLMLYNGAGLWRSLLEESGYGQPTISPFFGPPIRDAKLERLLAALGYTYPQMLRELTVLPFWLSFNQATNAQSRINVDAASGRITKLTTLGHSQFLPGARYCPACLRDDIEAHGEPYVHRQHQLPVACVCPRHGVALRFACPKCRITVMPFNRALLRPPALRCDCGEDLSRIAGPPPPYQQALLQLSRFAADALSCTEAPWTLGQVLAVLHQRSDRMRGSFKGGAMQLMRDAYGPPDKSRSRASALLTWEDAGSSLRLKAGGAPSLLRAPEFCALLAATGLSFDDFRQAVSQVEVYATPARSMPRPFTIEQARNDFERFEAESPGHAAMKLQDSSLRLYWLLRLRDSAFMRTYGYRARKPVPTIKADREKIEELLRHGNGRISNDVAARIRASIRDQAWLQTRIRAQSAKAATLRTAAPSAQQERAIALSRAVFSLLRAEARPARVHAGRLAKFVQISMHQAQHTIAHTPALQVLIAAVNANKNRRLAFWAARCLIEEGQHPTSQEVLVRAGLNKTRVNRQFCISAIACFAASRKIADASHLERHESCPPGGLGRIGAGVGS